MSGDGNLDIWGPEVRSAAAAADGASAPFAGSGDGVSPVLEAVIQEFQAAQLAELRRPGGYSKRDPHYLGQTVSTRMTVA